MEAMCREERGRVLGHSKEEGKGLETWEGSQGTWEVPTCRGFEE
jgi:hypothetical protein